MILPWRRKRGGRNRTSASVTTELTIPTDFRCPISLDLMKDPVTLSSGITYDRESIETWIVEQGHETCPVTKRILAVLDPIPNHAIRGMIQDWCVEKRSYGVERIPTPRIPLSSNEASDLLARLESSTPEIANALVARLMNKARESERNRRVILTQHGARVVAAKFEEFSSSDENGVVLDELLSCLAVLAPAQCHVGSPNSLKRIVSILGCGDLASRRNAVVVLKELVRSRAEELAATEGALRSLVNAIKDPVSPSSLKDSLFVIHHIIKTRPESVSELLDLGIVPEVVEIAISSERGVCEMALGVLDEACGEARGRVMACEHAMTVPVVVKKMLRVSDLATEFTVSVLWKMMSRIEEEEGVLEEAFEVGAFQKLLLVLQVGCGNGEDGRRTKEKVTELLKRLNVFQRKTGRLECVEPMDFKDLKRSF